MLWYIPVLASALFQGFANILRKYVLKKQHPLEQLASQAPMQLLVLLFLIPFLQPLPWQAFLAVVLKAFILFPAAYYRNKTYRHMDISVIAPMYNLSPVVLLLFASIIFAEQPTGVQLLGILAIVVGGYSLELKGFNLLRPFRSAKKSAYLKPVVLILIFVSILAMIDKWTLQAYSVDSITYFFYSYSIFAIISLLIHWKYYGMQETIQDLRQDGKWLFLIVLLRSVSLIAFFIGLGQPGVLVALAVPIRRLSTFIEVILGGHMFHEKRVLQKAVSCLIMVGGLLLLVQ